MPRTASILFTPVFGCKYFVKDKKGNKIVCRVLGPNDKRIYGVVRSPRKIERGQEFFKILIDDKVIKMLNSNLNRQCKSEDGSLTFTGERVTGAANVTKRGPPKNVKKEVPQETHIEFLNQNFNFLIKESV